MKILNNDYKLISRLDHFKETLGNLKTAGNSKRDNSTGIPVHKIGYLSNGQHLNVPVY